MPIRGLRSPLSLVVLGLLAEQSLHPYGIRVLMRERGHDRIVKARPASLYDAVTRLTDAGLIEVQESTRDGRRPERTVYRITNPGREELRAWVRDGLRDLESSERFVSALSFMFSLPKGEAVALLEERTEAVAATIDAGDGALAEALAAGVGEIFLSEERYTQSLRQAEYDWLAGFTQRLRDGTLRWPRPRRRQTAR
jgi:DNA-binding PadR family transcriptional regulator